MTPEQIAAGLTEAQRRYLSAVAASAEPYEPRHGRTANWALRHKLVDTIVVLNDGRSGTWDSFDPNDRFATGIGTIGGQRLTPLGLAVRARLQETSRV